jgi:hypothetical protein
MRSCRVTWRAEIRTRPDISDPRPYLAHGASALREHRYIEDARYEYDPHLHVVSFVLDVRWTISVIVAKCQAACALHDRLPAAGFDTARSAPMFQMPVAWLRFDWWPTSIRR